MSWKLLTSLALVVAMVSAGELITMYCDGIDQSKCTVDKVRITNCNGSNLLGCKENEALLSMDFTTHFAATKLKKLVIIDGHQLSDGPSQDACRYTTCPTAVGKRQQFHYGLNVSSHWLKEDDKNNALSVQVYDEADLTNNCCFATLIKLKNINSWSI